MNACRYRVHVRGTVQGVGFRPFVWKLANSLGATGWVRNDSDGVEIELQWTDSVIDRFIELLSKQPPPLARIESITVTSIPMRRDDNSFVILANDSHGNGSALVSPDIATCDDCLRELRDASNRRYAYPFINCTNCGPRFTIQTGVPYDRLSTTMRQFAMCRACQSEYESPADRRFHAQPNACHQCGPSIRYLSKNELDDKALDFETELFQGDQRSAAEVISIVDRVRQDVADGLTVAIKGIGGFHLACDATNTGALARLRQRKNRPAKPLSIMVADIETANRFAILQAEDIVLLSSPERPIVLVRKRSASTLSELVAPGNPQLGIMLPYSPVHHLLVRPGDVWVMTSGNLADEPIAYTNSDAIQRLRNLADGFLLHDRPIHTVCDDSVIRSTTSGAVSIRRSRGFAPQPIKLDRDGPCVLAVGGEIKTALCVTHGQYAFLSQHVGDMGNRETLDALDRAADHLLNLYQCFPKAIVADQHPGYLSVQWARQLADRLSLPLLRVQHHHAHAAALIAEHQLAASEDIIACVLDGTGYGDDGAIWGGEVLIANQSRYQRTAHVRYAPLPGGDSCILSPAKTALAYLFASDEEWSEQLACVRHFTAEQRQLLRTQLDKNINVSQTSSMGRLFDAVAALIGLRPHIDYEGQAALELESLAQEATDNQHEPSAYRFEWSDHDTSQFDYRPLIQQVVNDVYNQVDRQIIALRFHESIAQAIMQICQRVRSTRQESALTNSEIKVGLSGGVFQNGWLLDRCKCLLQASQFTVLTHQQVPPNDGGLALGQALVARNALARKDG